MDLSRQRATRQLSHPPVAFVTLASSKWASPESPRKYITLEEAHMDFPDHFQHIFQQLNHQRLHAQLCDCVVLVGSQSFQAHRSILAACSSHFRALLSSPDGDEGGVPRTDAAGGGEPSVIELDPGVVTPEAFSTLLDMIYTSTLIVGASDVMDVLLAASHLHLNTVVKACKLHLSKCNFPTSPPKGWRSPIQQHQQSPSSQTAIVAVANSRSVLLQHVGLSLISSAVEEELNEGEAGVEVSHSHGDENGRVGVSEVSGEHRTAFQTRHKRKSPHHEERPGSRQKTCRLSRQRYGSPTVTWSTSNREEGGEALPSPDSLKTDEGLLLESTDKEGEGEVEEKYETTKGEFEERQLPSQSDSSVAGVRDEEGGADGGVVVKVKVGEEGEDEEEEKMETVEVKRENLSSSSSPDLLAAPDELTPSTEYCTDHLDELMRCDKTSPSPPEGDCSSSNPQACTDPQADSHIEGGDGGVESIDSEGLDSLSDLALSCFLNPSSESVMGALEVEESLANLTATTTNSTIDEAHAIVGDSGESSQNLDATSACFAPSSSSASSLVFPVTSVPFQPLLPAQGHSFILQPSQSSLSGILGGIKSGLSLQTPFIQPSGAGRTGACCGVGAPAFRRIAPKVVPGSEARTDPQSPSSSSGSVGDGVQHPPLTIASEDVLSKCKKAASADHVLLVEGEKKYACRICCKTFMNLTDCKKHIRVHTGEKPYPCPKCGKRFSQSSHLYKHCNNTCLHWKNGP